MINSFRFLEGEMKIRLVRPAKQLKGQRLCFAIFAMCLSARFIEYFLIETDKTAIGENVLHKILGIVILAAALIGAVYQQLFVDWLSDQKYRLRFLCAVRTTQYRKCLDGRRYFSRAVY